jgi:DNA (cytosine-5)-methyltransferase 1
MTGSLRIKVFDFFTGCGGTCAGFRKAGLDIVFALDNDADCKRTFESNFNRVPYRLQDIASSRTTKLKPLLEKYTSHPKLFSGCAPCQPFTKQNTIRQSKDKRTPLLSHFARFIKAFGPEYVFVENVPGIQNLDPECGPLADFLRTLEGLGYSKDIGVIASQDYGVPQRRRRLLLIASRLGEIQLPSPTHGPKSTSRIDYVTVRDAIGDFPPLGAGESHSRIPNHQAASLSPLNLRRIQCLKEGEGREKWPSHLWLRCHSNGYKGHTDVYGRMKWDEPASGLTTRCISLSNGRFGHPEQNRAISIREAALLQTFPPDFVFHGSMRSMARQIGNAVPPRLAEVFGRYFVEHFKTHREVSRG